MERFVRSLKIVFRSERMLAEQELRRGAQRVQLVAVAALVAVFGLVMLGMAAFFALAPLWGNALAALAVGGGAVGLAVALVAWAGALQPPASIEMVREVRDMAIADLEADVAEAEAELVALRDEFRAFVRNPIDALLPAALGPIVAAVLKGLEAAGKEDPE